MNKLLLHTLRASLPRILIDFYLFFFNDFHSNNCFGLFIVADFIFEMICSKHPFVSWVNYMYIYRACYWNIVITKKSSCFNVFPFILISFFFAYFWSTDFLLFMFTFLYMREQVANPNYNSHGGHLIQKKLNKFEVSKKVTKL